MATSYMVKDTRFYVYYFHYNQWTNPLFWVETGLVGVPTHSLRVENFTIRVAYSDHHFWWSYTPFTATVYSAI